MWSVIAKLLDIFENRRLIRKQEEKNLMQKAERVLKDSSIAERRMIMHMIEYDKQELWFGTPRDLLQLEHSKRYWAKIENRRVDLTPKENWKFVNEMGSVVWDGAREAFRIRISDQIWKYLTRRKKSILENWKKEKESAPGKVPLQSELIAYKDGIEVERVALDNGSTGSSDLRRGKLEEYLKKGYEVTLSMNFNLPDDVEEKLQAIFYLD